MLPRIRTPPPTSGRWALTESETESGMRPNNHLSQHRAPADMECPAAGVRAARFLSAHNWVRVFFMDICSPGGIAEQLEQRLRSIAPFW
jgi:hypothetical protein